MITVLIAAVVVAVVIAGWWVVRHFGDFGKHAGGGEGALTVQQLLDQAAVDDVALRETRELPHAVSTPIPGGFALDPESMRQIRAGLHQL